MRRVARWERHVTGSEIHAGATSGGRQVSVDGMGTVIGESADVGDDGLLYQGVSLGGTGKDKGKRHPSLGNNGMVGSGAKVLGPFKVGDNARIAANAVVLQEVPADSTAVGIPARIVRKSGEKVNYAAEVDQIHVADPVALELAALRERLEKLENAGK